MATREVYLMNKAKQTNVNKKAFLKALEEKLGVISQASQLMGIDRTIVYDWIKKDSAFANKVKEVREEFAVDYVESKMLKKINEGESSMIMFFLNNRAKHRGYGLQKDNIQESELTIRLIEDDD